MQKNKKGSLGTKGVTALVGVLILAVLMGSLLPQVFSNLSNITSAPAWVNSTLPVIVGAGAVFMVWRSFR